MVDEIEALRQFDKFLKKQRAHFYKPIQIAELLFRHRCHPELGIELSDIETYRKPSRQWRDLVSKKLVGRVSSSSSRYQDDVFVNGIPPETLEILGQVNSKLEGKVEELVYSEIVKKYQAINSAVQYLHETNPRSFSVTSFINIFMQSEGLKRSVDKVFEILTYSLFETLATALEPEVSLSIDDENLELAKEFSEFSNKVLGLNSDNSFKITNGTHFYRVGVTNAADRGLDMYSNFGPVVQIKHISLSIEVANEVVSQVTSDDIVIVCQNSDEEVISHVLNAAGFQNRVRAIITIEDITHWYKLAINGSHSDSLREILIDSLKTEMQFEFPLIFSVTEFQEERNYSNTTLSEVEEMILA